MTAETLLDLSKLKAAWRLDVGHVADHFAFTESQRSQAAKLADESERWADLWFSDPENTEKRAKYLHDLDKVEETERDPNALEFQLERAWEVRRSVDADRRTLTGPLVERDKALREAVAKLATEEQRESAQEYVGLQDPTGLRLDPGENGARRARARTPPSRCPRRRKPLLVAGPSST